MGEDQSERPTPRDVRRLFRRRAPAPRPATNDDAVIGAPLPAGDTLPGDDERAELFGDPLRRYQRKKHPRRAHARQFTPAPPQRTSASDTAALAAEVMRLRMAQGTASAARRSARRRHAGPGLGLGFGAPLRALRWLREARVPRLGIPVMPIVLVAVFVVAPLIGTYNYNRGRAQVFLEAVRKELPALNAEIHDGAQAARHLELVAKRLDINKGPESGTVFMNAAKSLAEQAKNGQKHLQDIRLRLSSFEQLPILTDPQAGAAVQALNDGRWYEEANTQLKTWADRGESMRQLAEATRDFLGADPGREFKFEPISARTELLLRLQALAADLAKSSNQLNQASLTLSPDAPAARLAPRFTALADIIVKARAAVDAKDAAAFQVLGQEYGREARKLQEEVVAEMISATKVAEDQQKLDDLMRRVEAAARQVNTKN